MQYVSPYVALEQHAASQPDADALVIDDTRLSRAEMVERVAAYARWLTLNGISPGNVTGLCIRDDIDHLVCAMALLCLGAPQISLGAHETEQAKRQIALKVGSTQLIVEKVEAWMAGFRTIVVRRDEIDAAHGSEGSDLFSSSPLEAVAVYLNTSGTTSVPKTFAMGYGRLIASADRYMADPKDKRSVRPGSIEFDAIRLNRLCTLLAGNTCVGLSHFSLDSLVSICEREAVSVVRVGPYQLASLLRSAHPGRRLPFSTAILVSGARVCGALRKQVQAGVTHNLWVQYAASETGLVSTAAPDQHEAFPEGIGFPEAGVTVEIVGPDGAIVPPGEVGHIRIQKDTMASHYVADGAAQPKFRDGWFHPGDLVSRAGDEPLIFHGRADDLMILNGINIFPSAIEDLLESLPNIREAVAFPVKSRIHGEIPAAAVVLSDTAEHEDISRLLGYCQKVLGVRAPRQIRVVESIPRNAFGKPLKKELAAS